MFKSAFTCNGDEISSPNETRPRIKKFFLHVNFILGWNLIWKKTSHWVWWKHDKISHFSQLLKSEAWYVKDIGRLKGRCMKWLHKTSEDCNFIKKETLAQVCCCEFCQIFYKTPLGNCFYITRRKKIKANRNFNHF